MQTYNPIQASIAQAHFCVSRGYPNFTPPGGSCPCGVNIYQEHRWPDGHITGISVERAGKGLITACPHCHRTFCD